MENLAGAGFREWGLLTDETKFQRRQFDRLLWINFPILFCCVVVVLAAALLYNYSYYYYGLAESQAISRGKDAIRRVVLDVSQVFYSYDSVLKSSVALLGDEAIATLPDATKNRLASRMVEQFPYVTSIVFLDANGMVRVSPGGDPTVGFDYGAADFFSEQISGALVGPYLAFTTRTRMNKPDYQIAMSRRMTYDGQFRGVAVVFIRLGDFRDQFTNINVDTGNMLALVHENGRTLTRKPSSDGQGDFGVELSPADRARFIAEGEGTFTAASPVDGRERLFVFQHLPEWPLVLIFGVPVTSVYGEWRQRITLVGAGAGLVCAGFLFLGFRLRRERIRRVEAEAALEHLSMTDFLTGLANRRRFDEVLQREYRRTQRTESWLSVVIIDADRFKALNDRYGHSAGDETLKMIAAAITQHVRRVTDLAARLGGEEFAIILPDTSAAAAFDVVERIRSVMEERVGSEQGPPATTISAGIASTKDRPPPDSMRSLIEAADRALYRAKHLGRNRTELASAVNSVAADPEQQWEHRGVSP